MKENKKKNKRKPNTKARTYRNRVIKIVSLLLAIGVTTWFLQEYMLCNADHNTERIRGFYLEDENSLDVVIVGSSEVYCDYSAALAYEECGFTSYPYSTESNTALNYKAIIEEIKRTQNPQLIVIEINGAIYGDANLVKDVNLRRVSDNMPLNENKIELVEKNATSDKIEYYVPFLKYHSSWDNLNNSFWWSLELIKDQVRGYNYLKGIKNRSVIYHPKSKVYRTDEIQSRKMALFNKADVAFREFLEYLQGSGFTDDQILFVRFPHVVTTDNVSRYYRGNTVGDIVREYGFSYISFDSDNPDIGIDTSHDFYNQEHMNIYGQQKFTKYFAKYLQEVYKIKPAKLTEKQKEVWDKTIPYYDAYIKYSDQLINKGEDVQVGENYDIMRQIEQIMNK